MVDWVFQWNIEFFFFFCFHFQGSNWHWMLIQRESLKNSESWISLNTFLPMSQIYRNLKFLQEAKIRQPNNEISVKDISWLKGYGSLLRHIYHSIDPALYRFWTKQLIFNQTLIRTTMSVCFSLCNKVGDTSFLESLS